MPRGNPRLGFSRATAAASTDAVPFLKAPLRLLLDRTLAPGENPRSSDRAVTAFCRRALLEGTVLEFTTCGSPMVV
jgi:hypothetical protein